MVLQYLELELRELELLGALWVQGRWGVPWCYHGRVTTASWFSDKLINHGSGWLGSIIMNAPVFLLCYLLLSWARIFHDLSSAGGSYARNLRETLFFPAGVGLLHFDIG